MITHRLPAVIALTATLGAATVAGAGMASATTTASTLRAAAVAADPKPECNGANAKDCWEYYSWYWTYASCHDEGRKQLRNNQRRYDDYNCAGGHGAVVWLWLHRKS